MSKISKYVLLMLLPLVAINLIALGDRNPLAKPAFRSAKVFTDAAAFGFLPSASGVNNAKALQAAVNKGGTLMITKPGTYKLAQTVYIGDNTSLIFGDRVFLKKVDEKGQFAQVFLNKGALTRTYNSHISITGLNLQVNSVEKWFDEVYGLRGQLGFFYVKDLKIDRFRCTDLGKAQFCIHICTFEDVLINDVIIKGKKDGIHFGKGKRFKVSNAVFQTADDAIALAAGDWVTANPEFGDIENGVIENCYDLKADILEGAFAKIVPSAWLDWRPGMLVRHGDAVVYGGRIYRVLAELDDKQYQSITPPSFREGIAELDGIKWQMHQKDTIHSAVVKNVVFRDIFIESLRVPFQLMYYDNRYSHSYYRGAPMPNQEIALENITILNDDVRPLLDISTPCSVITIKNSVFRNNSIVFHQSKDFDVYPPTYLSLINCIFKSNSQMDLVKNGCKGKQIFLKTSGSVELDKNFKAKVLPGEGKITVESDLTGLK